MSARTAIQRAYVNLLRSPSAALVVATGHAGTGKTYLALAEAAAALSRGDVSRLILTRPTVSVDGENLGFLPGTAEEKLGPYTRPMLDALSCFLTAREIAQLRADGTIELAPLAYMRGRTFKNAWVVIDEAQNASPAQLRMALTRAGRGTKTIVTGDLLQSDVPGVNGLADLVGRLPACGGGGSSLVVHVELGSEDVQRSDVVKEVLRLYRGVSL